MPSLLSFVFGFFFTLTAAGRRVYRRAIAETTATKIGVLDTAAAMSRHAFAERLFYRPCSPFMGDRAGGAARLAGAVAGTPTLALVAHPDWRREGGYLPLRRNTMKKQDEIKSLLGMFHYDHESGEIRSIKGHRIDNSIDQEGYRRVSLWIGGKTNGYKAHRLAWLSTYGSWPTGDIDHINGVRHDNRIENLRDVDRRTNSQNQKKATSRNKTSGVLGVSWDKEKQKWAAFITINGKSCRLGRFDTVQEASDAYLEAKRQHHAGCTV